jgi:hypothetical protein
MPKGAGGSMDSKKLIDQTVRDFSTSTLKIEEWQKLRQKSHDDFIKVLDDYAASLEQVTEAMKEATAVMEIISKF